MKTLVKCLCFITLLTTFLVSTSCSTTGYVPLTKNTDIASSSYTNQIQPIIKNYCLSCHSGQFASRGINLSTYEEVRFQTEKGRLLLRINSADSPMPPKYQIPPKEREAINRWIKNNYLH